MNPLNAREAVKKMKEYHPPLSGRAGLRLDFNENTDAPSPRVSEVLARIARQELAKYPERAPVERLVAEFLGVGAEQVLLTNGVDEAIHLVCETYLEPEDEVIIVVPTFSMYEIYAQSTGATVIRIPADPGFAFPTAKVLAAISPRTRLIAVANPNNPTGSLTNENDLVRIARSAPHAAVLVDEAYFEFCKRTVLACVNTLPNLFVTRTFSKAYGLAGLRVGALVGRPEQMSLVRKVSSPYNVNAVALACLPEAISDREFIDNYVSQVVQGRGSLMIQLACLGVPYWISHANFVLAGIGRLHKEFVTEMRRRGILVRDRSSDLGCDGCVRFTVGTREHNHRLLMEFPEVLKAIGWRASEPAPAQAAR